MSVYDVGNAEVVRIFDLALTAFAPERLLPAWDAALIDTDSPLMTPQATADGSCLPMSVHSWLVREKGRTVLIDTGAGRHKARPFAKHFDRLDTGYLDQRHDAGVAPEDVDIVLHTHLHVDHVGWNTQLRHGAWVPTFPNARHVFSREEHAYFTNPANLDEHTRSAFAAQQDSVLPIVAAGLADAIDVDGAEPTPGFRFYATPGHSPCHASIIMRSGGKTAIFPGDVMHHPVQLQRPDWNSAVDGEPASAEASRRWALEFAAAERAQVFTSHFTGSSTGWISRLGRGWEWSPA